MEIRTGGRNHGKQRELIDRMCKEIADLRSQNCAQSTRIQELEGIAESVLFEVSRTISPELRERIEQALNKAANGSVIRGSYE